MNYNPPVPQGMLHAARGRMADGAGTRNRSMEQFSTNSGNPNMPMFNTTRRDRQQSPASAQGSMPSFVDMNAVNADPAAFQAYLQRAAQEQPNSAFGQLGVAQQNSTARTKPAPSFHQGMRPPMGPVQGGGPARQAVMPSFSPQPIPGGNVGSRYSSYFGRDLPMRIRG